MTGGLRRLGEDIDAIMARDPAARSRREVVLCYPGFHALLFHRLAHAAGRWNWLLDKGKRHPTLEDGVIVGSGAQILGPITVGAGARIGANAVVLKDVAPGVTMVGIPARQVLPRGRNASQEFVAYGTPGGELADPMVKALDGLTGEIEALRARIEFLEPGAHEDADEDEEKGSDEVESHGRSADAERHS